MTKGIGGLHTFVLPITSHRATAFSSVYDQTIQPSMTALIKEVALKKQNRFLLTELHKYLTTSNSRLLVLKSRGFNAWKM
jgi:hypothetical protein